jgi:hypothetical protein
VNNENDLYKRLSSIGINVSSTGNVYAYTDIEKTLLKAAAAITADKRVLSLILSWIKIHGERVNIERLKKLLSLEGAAWVSLLAHFAVYNGQTRWKILCKKPSIEIANGDLALTRMRIKMKGEEVWAISTGFLIPKDSEPITSKYILNPFQLAKINFHYRNKLIYGSNWRADIITAINSGAANPYQAAKVSGASYEPAHRTFEDLRTAGELCPLAIRAPPGD